IRAADAHAPEPRRRVAFEFPRLGRAARALRVDEDDNVRVDPVDFRQRPAERHAMRDVEFSGGGMVSGEWKRASQQNDREEQTFHEWPPSRSAKVALG